MRTAKRMGMETVAIYSEADALSRHVRMADHAVQVGLGSAASTSYLDVEAVLGCMASTGADCVHPGYGFLSENADFARAVVGAGHAFVGPPATAIDEMGDKLRSKEIATDAGVSVIPGGAGAVSDVAEALKISGDIGYPVMLKASAGGGGKGMRVAFDEKDVEEQWPLAKDEALRSFGDDRMLVEKFVQSPRHLEIQIVADTFGNVATFPERECSVQRRNQKVVEEAPSPFLSDKPELRQAMQREAAMLARSVGYASAGTVEMLVDGTTGSFYFLEMNTRLQVEHPITEAVSGEDLVELMLRVADGQRLPERLLGEGGDPCFVPIDGWAVESRIYAEDAAKNFLPSTGVLSAYADPAGAAHFDFGPDWTTAGKAKTVRVDSGIEDGAEISIYYDPMISKLVVTGEDRDAALANTRAALDAYVVEGLAHNVPFCRDICANETFLSGTYTTKFIEEEYAAGFKEEGVFAALVADAGDAARLAALVFEVDAAKRAALGALPAPEPAVVSLAPERKLGDAATFRVARAGDGAYAVAAAAAGDDGDAGAEPIRVALDGYAWPRPLVDKVASFTAPSGETVAVQHIADAPAPGFDHALRVRGIRVHAAVNSENDQRLKQHALPPPKPDSLSGLKCPMPGTLLSYAVDEGDTVEEGQPLAIVEAMKMQNILRAEHKVVVEKLLSDVGDVVAADQMLIAFVQNDD